MAGVAEEGSGCRQKTAVGAKERRRTRKKTSESAELRTMDRSKLAAYRHLLEQEVEGEVDRRMHALGIGRRTHDTCGGLAGAPTERAGHLDQDMSNQRELPSDVGEVSKRWEFRMR